MYFITDFRVTRFTFSIIIMENPTDLAKNEKVCLDILSQNQAKQFKQKNNGVSPFTCVADDMRIMCVCICLLIYKESNIININAKFSK